MSEVRNQMSEDGGQRTEDRGRRSEDRGQKTEVRRARARDREPQITQITQIETFAERDIFSSGKEGKNVNHRNILNISRIKI